MFTRSLLRVTEGGIKSSIHRSIWEQSFLPFDRAKRAIAKLLVDGAGVGLAEGMAAGALLIWLRIGVGERDIVGTDIRWITWLLLMIIIVWLLLSHGMSRSWSAKVRAVDLEEAVSPETRIPDS